LMPIVEPRKRRGRVTFNQLTCEESKLVVGAAMAKPVPVGGKGLIAEIFRDIVRVIEKDLGLLPANKL
jgi:hypothetical protein